MFVRKGSDINQVTDLKGKTEFFGGDEIAMMNYIAPKQLLIEKDPLPLFDPNGVRIAFRVTLYPVASRLVRFRDFVLMRPKAPAQKHLCVHGFDDLEEDIEFLAIQMWIRISSW